MEAEGTSETHGAQAREGVDPINTCATIETGAEERMGDDISSVICGPELLLKSRVLWDKHLRDSDAHAQEVLQSSKLD